MFPGFTGLDDAHASSRCEIAMAAHGLSVVELERVARQGPVDAGRPAAAAVQPPDHRLRHRVRARPARPPAPTWLQTAADPTGRTVLGTLNNCAGGTTPWGTVLSGEENFNQYFAAPTPHRRAKPTVQPVRHRHRRARPGDSRKWERVDERFDLAEAAQRGQPLRLGRRVDPFDPDSTPAQAHRAGPLQARGRQRDRRRRTATRSPTWATTSASTTSTSSSRTRRCMHGRRRAARKHNLTLLDEGTLYVAKLTGDQPPPRSTAPASCPPTARSTAPGSGSRWSAATRSLRRRDDRRGGARLHPARRRQGRRRPRWTAPRTSSRPAHRQGLRGADQQHRPRHGRQGRRPTRPTRATPTSTATSWSSPRTAATTPRDDVHLVAARRLRRPGRTRRPTSPGYRQDQVSPDLLPGQRRLRRRRQPVDLHRRQRARASQRRPVRASPLDGPRARSR